VDELPDDLIDFLQTAIGSIWALELMLTLRREPQKAWTVPALTAELRASEPLVADIVRRFESAGLATAAGPGAWAWHPASPRLATLADAAAAAYARTPLATTRVIADARTRRIRQFADAFRLRPDKDSR
jgi:hypothetical protein